MTGVDSSPPVIVSVDDAARYSLGEGVAAVQVGRDLVFLDLQHDQYSCLPNPPGLELKGSELSVGSGGPVEALLSAGLVRAVATCVTPQAAPPVQPSRDLRGPSRCSHRAWRSVRFPRLLGRSVDAVSRPVDRSAGKAGQAIHQPDEPARRPAPAEAGIRV